MNAGAEVCKVPKPLLDQAWAQAQSMIDNGRGVAPTLLSDDVLDRLHAGELQLWFVLERGALLAVFFTDINSEPDGHRWLCVQGLGGRQMWRWAGRMHDEMISFAKHHGCAAVRFSGRRGYERLFRDVRAIGQTVQGEPIYERAI